MPDIPQKIFISWSKSQSKRVAAILRVYLREVLEGVEIFMSDSDISPGARSLKVLEQQLDGTSYGIAVVTKENHSEPWLNFEAGALSKAVANDEQGIPYVVPLLVDIESATELTGPISQFQAVKLDKDGIIRTVSSICDLIKVDRDIAITRLNRAWDEMAAKLSEASVGTPDSGLPARDVQDKIDEILVFTRTLQRVTTLEEMAAHIWWVTENRDKTFARETEFKSTYGRGERIIVLHGGFVEGYRTNAAGEIIKFEVATTKEDFPTEFVENVVSGIFGRRVIVVVRHTPHMATHIGEDQVDQVGDNQAT